MPVDVPAPIHRVDSPLQRVADDEDDATDVHDVTLVQKKKKKRKPKKSAAAKAREAEASAGVPGSAAKQDDSVRQPVLSISRNKHWRYISSYHGPWLQLPVELLDSLLALNMDPIPLAAPRPSRTPSTASSTSSTQSTKRHITQTNAFPDLSPPSSPQVASTTPTKMTFSKGLVLPEPGKPTPPPVDPGVFRNVSAIRRLIDEASELSVRASSGLSAAELNSMRSTSNLNGSYNSWGGMNSGSGRNVAMSAMRIHRLRALAVQKLATAYRTDEIASSVMVMQGGAVFDDLAERVLKVDPNDSDARYVHFFHEKIPSRQLAEFTTTQVLDDLIERQPQRLEYYRTRGIVHCFRDEFLLATKDFTHALKEARAIRKAKVAHHHNYSTPAQKGKSKNGKKKKGGKEKAPSVDEEGGEARDDPEGIPAAMHPSVLDDAPTPLEPQLLFLRGATYLQQAIFLIETAIFKLEGILKLPASAGGGSIDLRLSFLDGGVYGGVEVGNPDGPLGRSSSNKAKAYRELFGVAANGDWQRTNGEREKLRDQIVGLVKKSMRDHERFLGHFETVDAGQHLIKRPDLDIGTRVAYAFDAVDASRPGHQPDPEVLNCDPRMDAATTYTTYHPLMVEAHFSILLCYILLGDFTQLLPTFLRTSRIVDNLEGYPVFLPPRSLAQAEFLEVLERLATGFQLGVGPYTDPTASRGKEKAEAMEEMDAEELVPPPLSASSSSTSSSRNPTPVPPSPHSQALNTLRILLSPIAARQRDRENEKSNPKSKKPAGINSSPSLVCARRHLRVALASVLHPLVYFIHLHRHKSAPSVARRVHPRNLCVSRPALMSFHRNGVERYYGSDGGAWDGQYGGSISAGPARTRQSAFSDDSDDSSSSDDSSDDYGEADPTPAATTRTIAKPPPKPAATNSGSDDDVPLAQKIPSALKAQRTIRRKVREERDQRRREKAEGRGRSSRQRPAGAGDSPSMAIASSSQEAARLAEALSRQPSTSRTRTRQRTQTLPGAMQSPVVDDLTMSLQNAPPVPPLNTAVPADASKQRSTISPNPTTTSPHMRSPALPESRGLRPMRSFHRPKTAEPLSTHADMPLPGDAETKVRRSNTTRRPADDGRHRERERHHTALALPAADVAPPIPSAAAIPPPATSKLTKAPPPAEMRAGRASGETQLKSAAEVLSAASQATRHVANKSLGSTTRVFVGDVQTYGMVDVGPTTTAKEVLTVLEDQGYFKGWVGSGGWMVFEVAQDFGMERPIRSFEQLADVEASWNKDKMVNRFICRLTPLAPILSRSNLPSSSPLFSGYIDWEYKRGKWTKRYMRLREHSIFLSKRETGKDETCLCSLSNFDVYRVTRLIKSPKPFAFALKSTDNLSYFENTDDYVHHFSCKESDGLKWMEKILLARSYVLYQEKNVLFNKPTAAPTSTATRGLARAPTRKGPAPAPLIATTDRNDVFAPGSLLRS
ncbi:CRAL-TRIO-N domain-containing protein [Mycena kentingensis (nom. inval.)]|nr:CRAL-TRIO-N domain-containing protein [Mycena kentingensis (nom. inval.)]